MIPFNIPTLLGNEEAYIREAIAKGQVSGDGHFTRLCNARIAELTGARAALLTHSCTAALEMAAILMDLKPGDEVIMPSFTFVSTANAVVLRGAVPVFVDVEPGTFNIDPEQVAAAITPRTRAITAVHYAGFPADMDALADLARAHGLWLVEDAAQAMGSRYKGRLAGALGDIGCVSFHETKNIISGEGGAITLNRDGLLERAEIIREKGTDRSRFLRGQTDKYTWVDIGSSFLPGELVAAFLCAQLEQSTTVTLARKAAYQTYFDAFGDLAEAGRVARPYCKPDCEGNGHMFYLLLRDGADRDLFIAHMQAAGIVTPFHYVPLHNSPFGARVSRAQGDLPVTADCAARLVRLPMYYGVDAHQEQIISAAMAYLASDDAA